MVDAMWYSPVCDNLLRKIAVWYVTYQKGDVAATRKWVNIEGRVVDKVTRWANKIRFKPEELDHLIRILDAVGTTEGLSDFFRTVKAGLKRGKWVPGGEYEVILNTYPQDVADTLQALLKAKTGKLKSVEDIVKEQVTAGKSPFEV